ASRRCRSNSRCCGARAWSARAGTRRRSTIRSRPATRSRSSRCCAACIAAEERGPSGELAEQVLAVARRAVHVEARVVEAVEQHADGEEAGPADAAGAEGSRPQVERRVRCQPLPQAGAAARQPDEAVTGARDRDAGPAGLASAGLAGDEQASRRGPHDRQRAHGDGAARRRQVAAQAGGGPRAQRLFRGTETRHLEHLEARVDLDGRTAGGHEPSRGCFLHAALDLAWRRKDGGPTSTAASRVRPRNGSAAYTTSPCREAPFASSASATYRPRCGLYAAEVTCPMLLPNPRRPAASRSCEPARSGSARSRAVSPTSSSRSCPCRRSRTSPSRPMNLVSFFAMLPRPRSS